MRITTILALVALLVAAACGGTDEISVSGPTQEEQFAAIQARASEARAQVEALASTEPCTASSQCSVLVLRRGFVRCASETVIDYSTASPTAQAASAAADRFNELQTLAEPLAPPDNTTGSCTQLVNLMPLHCIANKCVRAFYVGPD